MDYYGEWLNFFFLWRIYLLKLHGKSSTGNVINTCIDKINDNALPHQIEESSFYEHLNEITAFFKTKNVYQYKIHVTFKTCVPPDRNIPIFLDVRGRAPGTKGYSIDFFSQLTNKEYNINKINFPKCENCGKENCEYTVKYRG